MYVGIKVKDAPRRSVSEGLAKNTPDSPLIAYDFMLNGFTTSHGLLSNLPEKINNARLYAHFRAPLGRN